ncbi:DUF1707 SHOCT-like domain-containing protein [Saccharothrix yanglingensis]|uniref:DUF1707 domain-containing protein n=1 Tax=Saccharothrix yanglingensis TaxID=659496 RepID=A0ABU0X4X4_9PSEU|nr:DUF1707 domain-containing protein [Saccharothrix yanglingensis]MDQ2587165.1 hypothetical protein [Saccharothrix yanglingensis]
MSERDIRIGDAEREHALELLGEHLGQGRLTVDEFGERSARVATARTRGDLLELFADLPDPRPRFRQVAPAEPPARRSSFALEPRMSGVVLPVVLLGCVALFFVLKNPFVFLLVLPVMLLLGRSGKR